jgi:hypothetical protein
MNVEELLAAKEWRQIPHCPGRFTLTFQERFLSPQQMAEVDREPMEFRVDAAKDPVLVLPLNGGGLITYRRADGSYHHTLNTEEGFRRKARFENNGPPWFEDMGGRTSCFCISGRALERKDYGSS